MAKGIDWVVNNSHYEVLSDSARNSAIKNFDSAVIASQYIALYKDLISKDKE
jgi:glycosyltransferase involved in cell wall biosynthesis